MPELIQVDWSEGAPFYQVFKRLVILKARRWKGQPTEALGYVWEYLDRQYVVGTLVDPHDAILRTIIFRKVSNFYNRYEKPRRAGAYRVSLDEIDEAHPSRVGAKPSSDEATSRELSENVSAAMNALSPQRREAILSWLKCDDVPRAHELAERWDTTVQNVYMHKNKGLKQLQIILSKFA